MALNWFKKLKSGLSKSASKVDNAKEKTNC